MNAPVTDLGYLIEAVALDVALWPQVLSRLSETVGADGAALIHQNQDDGRGESVIVGIDPAATPLYFGEYADRNPLQRAGSLREKIENFRPRILNDEHLLPKDELLASDFYDGVLRPYDMHSILMVGLGMREIHRVGINFVRGRKASQFEDPELALLAPWHAGLIRAFDVGMALAPVLSLTAELTAVLDTLADAIFLVDSDSRILFQNNRAAQAVGDGDALRVVRGRLRPSHPDSVRRLERLIGAATCGRASAIGGAMPLSRRHRTLPLSLTVTPLARPEAAIFPVPGCAMVRVADLERPAPVAELQLVEFLGLTSAEARVASAIAEGLSPREAADRLGVSVNTVRAQLARVFEKAGVRRQAELVGLISRLVDHSR